MAKSSGKSNSKRAQNGARAVESEVFTDKKASNMLSFKRKEYQSVSKGNKTRNRKVDQGKIVKKKQPKVYTAKELGLSKLNTSLAPVGVKVKGKKGKKFVTDSMMDQILAEVNESSSATHASKLEKARQLESIREAKRKEMEDREQAKIDKVERKKGDIKKKSGKKAAPEPSLDDKDEQEPKRKRKVAFA